MYILVFQHIACEDLGTAAEVFAKEGIELRTVRLYAGELPPADWQNAAGLIFLGGPMNVYQERKYPYLKLENDILKEAIALNKPILGICLGAQLIAKAAGARVYAGAQKEIGWYSLNLLPQAQNGLLTGIPSQLSVFQWHGDTFDLPNGATHLASSELFPHQAFSLGKNIYAFQFHLEVNLNIIEEWLNEYSTEVSDLYSRQQIEAIRSDSLKYISGLEHLAQTVFKRFADTIKHS